MNSNNVTQRTGLLSVAVFMLCGLTTAISIAQESSSTTPLTQFGHLTNWESDLRFEPNDVPSVVWSIKAGFGRGQIVGRDGTVYVTAGFDSKKDKTVSLTMEVKAIDPAGGETKWTYTHVDDMLKDQENFSGATIGPQATPAISGDRLFAISFTGQLICLKLSDGTVLWEKNLVGELGATPVQFGFSSSPVLHPTDTEKIFVLAAGETGGLYCLNTDDGSTIWKSEIETFSYATPTLAKLGGVEQLVLVSSNAVLGVKLDTGKRLWQYELAEKGLTNVPSPLVIDDSHLVISGQGCKGTRGLEIVSQNGVWDAEEVWHLPKVEYFYTNWLKLESGILLGCTDKLLVALNPIDGSILGRWRGFSDGNVLLCGDTICLLDGKSNLNILDLSKTGLSLNQKYSVAKGRSWTPLSVVDNHLFVRSEDQLVCLRFDKLDSENSLKNSLAEAKPFEFKQGPKAEVAVDPVEQISTVFESNGQDAALKLYQKLRTQVPSPLTIDVRIELAEGAREQGLTQVADMVLADALEDFPDSEAIKTAMKND